MAVVVHVAGLWITSPPDMIDALLFASPTPFSPFGVIAMWAIFAVALLAALRRRLGLRPRTWRIAHMSLAVVIVVGSVLHGILIEGTMETMSKAPSSEPKTRSARSSACPASLCGQGSGLAAGLFSVMLDARYTQAQVDAFCDGLKLFKIGYSWGGPVSLVMPYDIRAMRQHASTHLQPGTLVRFSVGLESAAALREDLQQSATRHLPLI